MFSKHSVIFQGGEGFKVDMQSQNRVVGYCALNFAESFQFSQKFPFYDQVALMRSVTVGSQNCYGPTYEFKCT
jgi:hypothetical protein